MDRVDFSEEFKEEIKAESLEDIRERVLLEMRCYPALTDASCEFLLQTYTDKIAELYY